MAAMSVIVLLSLVIHAATWARGRQPGYVTVCHRQLSITTANDSSMHRMPRRENQVRRRQLSKKKAVTSSRRLSTFVTLPCTATVSLTLRHSQTVRTAQGGEWSGAHTWKSVRAVFRPSLCFFSAASCSSFLNRRLRSDGFRMACMVFSIACNRLRPLNQAFESKGVMRDLLLEISDV